MLRIILMRDHMNAVDDNDNLVGFSTEDDCCAHGGWFVSEDVITDSNKFVDMTEGKEYPHHYFDTHFFETHDDDMDGGGLVVFKMISYGGEEKPLYLHLYNCHNGYYGKGWSKKFPNDTVEGCI